MDSRAPLRRLALLLKSTFLRFRDYAFGVRMTCMLAFTGHRYSISFGGHILCSLSTRTAWPKCAGASGAAESLKCHWVRCGKNKCTPAGCTHDGAGCPAKDQRKPQKLPAAKPRLDIRGTRSQLPVANGPVYVLLWPYTFNLPDRDWPVCIGLLTKVGEKSTSANGLFVFHPGAEKSV
jgi:hypothetical protein